MKRIGELMALLVGPRKLRLKGWKELSENEPVLVLDAQEEVCIPAYGFRNCGFEMCVKAGDQVSIGSLLAKCEKPFVLRIYASVSGSVEKIEKHMHYSLKPVMHIHLKNDHKNMEKAPLKVLDVNLASPQELLEFVKEISLVGLGGAGFPTYMKYCNVKDVNTLIINGVECEPYITSDYAYTLQNTAAMVNGIRAMKKMSNAKEVIIAIKSKHQHFIEIVNKAISEDSDIRVQGVDDVYPMGWERTLVGTLLHQEYEKLPTEVGAIVNNLSTAISLGESLKSGMPMVRVILTVSGDAIVKPQNVDVPIGYPIPKIIEACQGTNCEEGKLIIGGLMMGNTMVSDQIYADRAMNSLLLLKHKEYREVACLRCGNCSDICPIGLQPVRIVQAMKANDKKTIEKMQTNECVECGLCSYVCPSRLEVSENVRRAKKLMALQK